VRVINVAMAWGEVFVNQPQSDLWGTPPELRQAIERKLGLTFSAYDPCPYPLPLGHDGLLCDWGGVGSTVFVNPPFTMARQFAEKAVEQASKGRTIVLFIAARLDNAAWQHTLLPYARKTLFLRSRVKFVNLGNRELGYHAKAAFPSAAVVLEASSAEGNMQSVPWDWMADVKAHAKM
jgi:hypothetical protein